MRSILTPYKLICAEQGIFNKSVLALIFCFPILSLSLRHWLSGIYGLLVILAAITLFNKNQRNYPEEKVLMTLTILLVAGFLLSATLNDWSVNSIRRIGNVTKYIFFIPFYLLARRYYSASYVLLSGILFGSIVLGMQALYDVTVLSLPAAEGIYGSIIFGDLSALFFGFLLVIIFMNRNYFHTHYMLGIALFCAVFAGLMSGSRNAWLSLVFSLIAIPLLSSKFINFKRMILVLIPIIVISTTIITSYKPLQDRLLLGVKQIDTFLTEGAPKSNPLVNNAIGIRLEQWRSALHIFKDAPWFGYGGGNAAKHVNQFVMKGNAHPDLYNPDNDKNIGGLHSMYFETLLNEGLVGLTILLTFLFYPLYVFIKTYGREPLLSTIGIVFVCNYFIFGITENPFVHDNFTSVYLVFLAVLFSAVVRLRHTPPGANTHTAT